MGNRFFEAEIVLRYAPGSELPRHYEQWLGIKQREGNQMLTEIDMLSLH